ncbi:hypothetical protein [Nocardia sp. BMG111209]|uniref:hypothetical protein n=1 Tax=Nocardia sp. BMG111209 TaxID=1160137 RepID=UPI0018CAA006|nr:hypothetical protein [Nocardia sp. BMG111209]
MSYLAKIERRIGDIIDRGRTRAARPAAPATGGKALTIYLSDHYTGAPAGIELARRLTSNHRGSPIHATLRDLQDQVSGGCCARSLLTSRGYSRTCSTNSSTALAVKATPSKNYGEPPLSPSSTRSTPPDERTSTPAPPVFSAPR